MSPRRWMPMAMHQAAQSLLGKHDFTSFRAAACQAKSPIRTLDRLDVSRDGDVITMIVEARSFLHHQVRNFAGTLRLVGDGKWPVERVAAILAARDRSAAGPTAPAEGLCLMQVRYQIDPFSGEPLVSNDAGRSGEHGPVRSRAAPGLSFVFRVACGASHPIVASGSASVVGKYGLMSSNGVPSTQSRNRTSN